jgi:hypothetical protein
MGATTILILTLLAGDPARMVAGYFRPPAPAQLENAEQFPAPAVLLALPNASAEGNYPILLDLDELQALYAHTRRPALLYDIARRYQSAGNDTEAEVYFRAFLDRAPALDPYHDEAWNSVVSYVETRRYETERARVGRARAAVPAELAVLLAVIGGGW